MVKNGDIRFLLLEFILANQLVDLHHLVVASSGKEWQYVISTVRAHTGRSNPLVVTSNGQEWQYDISTVRTHIGRSTGRVKSGNM